jgi:hypothetical protein
MDGHLVPPDLLTGHKPGNCKGVEINGTITAFLGREMGRAAALPYRGEVARRATLPRRRLAGRADFHLPGPRLRQAGRRPPRRAKCARGTGRDSACGVAAAEDGRAPESGGGWVRGNAVVSRGVSRAPSIEVAPTRVEVLM